MRTPNRKPLTVQTVLKQMLCLFLSVIVLAPLYLVLINSFKTKSEAARMNLSLPTQWMFSNYPDVFKKANLLTGFGNSMLYSFASTTAGVLLCAMAAYVLSRKRTKLNNFIYYFFICTIHILFDNLLLYWLQTIIPRLYSTLRNMQVQQ
mgnify:CR=1 FL=1